MEANESTLEATQHSRPSAAETLAGERVVSSPDPAAAPGRSFAKGETIDRYVLLERIGAGGMGVVYAAYDPQLDRRVALKVLRPDGFSGQSSTRARRKLIREAQSMAKLSHRNVVVVHDVGANDDGEVFLAMEFIDGPNLRGWLQQDERSPQEILKVFVQAGRGLQAAHQAGLIHRDFKPDNVLVSSKGRVVVTDFGIAQAADSDDVSLTSSRSNEAAMSQVAGTPMYMSPEQHKGLPLTTASDQFSFCIALHHALFGVHPFRGETPVELAASVVGDDRQTCDDRGVAKAIRQAIDRGLALDPGDRWPSMRALLAALEGQSSSRRTTWLAVGGASLIAALSLALWFGRDTEPTCPDLSNAWDGVWDEGAQTALEERFLATAQPYAAKMWAETDRAIDRYTGSWVDLRTATCRARHRGELSDDERKARLRCLDHDRVLVEQLVAVLHHADAQGVARAPETVAGLPAVTRCIDPQPLGHPLPDARQKPLVERAEAVLGRAEAESSSGHLSDARALIDEALELANDADYAPLVARANLDAGRLDTRLGQAQRGEARLRHALIAAQHARDPALEIAVWLRLLETMGYFGSRPEEARRWVPLVEDLLRRHPQGATIEADFEQVQGLIAHQAADWATATKHFKRALRRRIVAHGDNDAKVIDTRTMLIVSLVQQGRYSEARPACTHALERAEAVLGQSHPNLALTARTCAIMERHRGNDAAAQRLFERAHAVLRDLYGDEHPQVALTMSSIGSLQRQRGQLELAERSGRDAERAARKSSGADHVVTAQVQAELAATLLRTGQTPEAAALLERSRQTLMHRLGPSHPRYAETLRVHAELAVLRDELDSAAADLEHAIAILGDEHPDGVELLRERGEIDLARDRADEAKAWFERARRAAKARPLSARVRARLLFSLAKYHAAADPGSAEISTLAQQSLALFAAHGDEEQQAVDDLQRWLDQLE